MIIKLFQPPSMNWLLMAEQLNDPPTWDRFLPIQLPNTERTKFETAVKDQAGNKLKVTLCRNLVKRGMSLFEYDWNSSEDEILLHAIQVAESLGIELQTPDRDSIPAA